MAVKSKKALTWSLGYEFLRLFVRIFGLYILSKILTPTDYGQMAAFLIGTAAASVMSELLRYEILRRPSMSAADYLAYHRLSVQTLWVYLPFVVVVMAFLNPTSLEPFQFTTLIALPLAVYVAIEHFLAVRVMKLQRHYKQKVTSQADFLGYFTTLVLIAIPGAYLGLGPYALVLSYVANSAFRAFLLSRSVRLTHRHFGAENTKRLDARTFFGRNGLEASRIATNKVLNQMPSALIGRNYGTAALGNFNRSSYVVDQSANSVGRAIGSVILRFAAINFGQTNNKNQRVEVLNSAVCVVLVLLIYLSQGALQTGFIWFFGELWIEAASIFAIVVYALPLKIAIKASAQILRGIDASRTIFFMQVLAIGLIFGAALVSQSVTEFCTFLVAELALRKIVYFLVIMSRRNARPSSEK